ncbi:hypothetical protein K505DRAFT_156167 [Melanomma pulvis-pyrius CBS 109.77]|uniref:Uncharacterized protein n=1 Tax=Melanomma pulvis-pyrius CBS 109.77 TaxID=1314802 RepID=A0A6A6WQ23_9PLEO|nr:hypothetical protein K505DRAFT_156167 [Melanomma pulvis-pyrius CBS 109.77]
MCHSRQPSRLQAHLTRRQARRACCSARRSRHQREYQYQCQIPTLSVSTGTYIYNETTAPNVYTTTTPTFYATTTTPTFFATTTTPTFHTATPQPQPQQAQPQPQPQPQHQQPYHPYQQGPPPLCTRTYYRGPATYMAALLLGAIGLGAQTVLERREKKRARKAALAEAALAENLAGDGGVEGVRGGSARGGKGEREGDGEMGETGEGLPPPSYEEVVRLGGLRAGG